MRFTDVPETHTHADDIEWLADVGVTKGINPPENTKFGPDLPVTRGQMASFLRRLHDLETVQPEEPEPDRNVVWSTDFSNGYADYEQSNPYSNSGNARGEIVDAPDRQGKAVAMVVTDAFAGTGVRLRQDGATINIPGYSGAKNLPDDAYYSAWFYIPEHITITGHNEDSWDIFQWKQTWPRTGGYTRRQLGGLKLRDLGDRYAFTYKTRIMTDGSFGAGSTFEEFFSDDTVTVRAGEWFKVEARRLYSATQGRLQFWVDGQLVFDLHKQTEFVGGDWDDYGPWRRQWTVNNYVVGDHTPNSHVLYVADLEIAV